MLGSFKQTVHYGKRVDIDMFTKAVYISPHENAKEVHCAVNKELNVHPEGTVAVAGFFNHRTEV